MSIELILTLVFVAVFLIIDTTYFLVKGKIVIKYSLLWYFFSLIILLVSIFPSFFVNIATFLGFEVMSNFIIAIFICLLILVNIALSIIITEHEKKITLLIQELSILKSKK